LAEITQSAIRDEYLALAMNDRKYKSFVWKDNMISMYQL